MTSRATLFVAPEAADRAFRRVASGLPANRAPTFHSMLLLDPQTDLSAWSIGEEVEAITRVADAGSTWDLVGYSGGAAICLAFAAANLGRVGSLILSSRLGSGMTHGATKRLPSRPHSIT